jgi:hypothetical protein
MSQLAPRRAADSGQNRTLISPPSPAVRRSIYNSLPNYDISRDGRRFLMVQPSAHETATPSQIIVVLNWFNALKRLVPAN